MSGKKKGMPKGVLLFTPLPWRLSGAGLALADLSCTLNDRQLLELIGLTQFTVDGRMFYSSVPPMSVSSTGAPASMG